MGFHNVTLDPKFIGYGSLVGPGHQTVIADSQSGIEPARKKRWSQGRRRFTLSNQLDLTDVQELFDFVLARRGSAHSFLIRDPLDYTTASDDISASAWDDVVIGTGDGSKTEFTLRKKYTSGATTVDRILNKPLLGQVRSGHTAAEKTLNVDFTIDHQIGRISYITAPPTGDVKAGSEFRNQVRFGKSVDNLLGLSYNGFREASYSIDLVEEMVPVVAGERHQAHSELTQFGGGTTFSEPQIDDFQVEFEMGRFLEFTPDIAANVRLPDINTLVGGVSLFTSGVIVPGGPYFVLYNAGAAAITLREFDSASWGDVLTDPTIAADRARECWVDDAGIWRAH